MSDDILLHILQETTTSKTQGSLSPSTFFYIISLPQNKAGGTYKFCELSPRPGPVL